MATVSPPARRCRCLGRQGARQRDAAAQPRQPLGREQRGRRDGHGGGIGEMAVAVGEGQLDRLHHHVHVVGFVEGGEIETLADAQQGQGGHALRGRREARGRAAAPADGERLHPFGPVRGEVLHAQRAPRGCRGGDQTPTQRAAVQLVRPPVANRLQRAREIGLHQRAPGEGVWMIEGPEPAPDLGARRGPEEVGLARWRAALPCRGREALARIGDGVGEQVLPAQRRVHGGHAVTVSLPPAVHRARHGEGGEAPAGGKGLAHAAGGIPVDASGGRRAAGAAQRVEAAGARVPEQPEVVAPHPVHVGIDHGDGGGSGDGRVERIAAGTERGHAGLGSEQMRGRHHAARGMRLGPSGGGGDGHRAPHPTLSPDAGEREIRCLSLRRGG